jgi:hypothetical protein
MDEPAASRASFLASGLDNRLQPLLIAAMLAAFMLAPIHLLKAWAPDEHWRHLPLVLFLVALEACLTTLWLERAPRWIGRASYRLAELVTILVLLRLVLWLWNGTYPTLANFQIYMLRPFLILDPNYVVYIILTVFTWQRATLITGYFTALRPDAAETGFLLMSDQERQEAGLLPVLLKDRVAIFRSFIRSWIFGGALLALIASLTTVNIVVMPPIDGSIPLRSIARSQLHPEVLLALLGYFLIGLWLASQGHLSVLRVRWMAENMDVDPVTGRRWNRLSVVLLAAAATVAAFLPIGSTLGLSRLFQALAAVLVPLSWLLTVLISLAVYVIALIASRLFPTGSGYAEEPWTLPPAAEVRDPGSFALLGGPGESLALLLGALFWVVVLVGAGVAIFHYLRQRSFRFRADWFVSLWAALAGWMASVRNRLSAGMRELSLARLLGERRAETGSAEKRPARRFVRINALSARDQVRYFYLSIVRRAGDRGLRRGISETPLEYSDQLASSWPEARADVAELTEAFLQARYSRQVVAPEVLNPARAAWRRLRGALKQRPQAPRH